MNIGHVSPANSNLFEELGVRDAVNEELRVKLLVELNNWYQTSGLTQTQAAKIVGVAQPTFNNALKYHFEKFKVDRLLSMVGRTGQPFQLLFGEDAVRWKAQQKTQHQKSSGVSTLLLGRGQTLYSSRQLAKSMLVAHAVIRSAFSASFGKSR